MIQVYNSTRLVIFPFLNSRDTVVLFLLWRRRRRLIILLIMLAGVMSRQPGIGLVGALAGLRNAWRSMFAASGKYPTVRSLLPRLGSARNGGGRPPAGRSLDRVQ